MRSLSLKLKLRYWYTLSEERLPKMALPFRMLCLAAKLSGMSEIPAFSQIICRVTHRDVNVWMGQRYSHRDRNGGLVQTHEMSEVPEVEDEHVKLQALLDETTKRQKAIKHHKIKRLMTAPGAPERRLNWDAIEQIRYLKRERPEEWTVERLAEGFSVSSDVIARVLRSKSVPTPERRARQDAKVSARYSQQAISSGGTEYERLQLPAGGSPVALATVASQSLLPARRDLVPSTAGPPSHLPTKLSVSPAVHTKHNVTVGSVEGQATKANVFKGEVDEEEEEMWDGQVFTEEDVEQLMSVAKVSPVVQIGKDVFDAEGNFLYRI